MKKISILVFTISLLLTACAQGNGNEQLQNVPTTSNISTKNTVPGDSTSTVLTTVPTTLPTTIPTPTPTTVTTNNTQPTVTQQPTQSMPMTQSFVHARTLEEYNQFIGSRDMPEWFVTYDQLSHIGTFSYFTFRSDAKNGQYHAYYYSLKLNSGEEVSLRVHYLFGREHTPTVYGTDYSKMHAGDLRNIEYKEQGHIWVENVLYSYIESKLIAIKWTDENNSYSLSGGSLHEIPTEAQSECIRKFLHTDTVTSAKQNFQTHLESAAVK